MSALTHKQAIHYLHEVPQKLSANQRTELAAHLAECQRCRAYAEQLSVLQPALTQALRTRRYPRSADSSEIVPALLQHKRRSTMRKQTISSVVLVVVAAVAIVVLFAAQNPSSPQTVVQPTALLITPSVPPSATTMPEPQNTPTLPPPAETSQLDPWNAKVDIGVATLHIRCLGQGSPTVILNGGPGETWITWQQVMQGVAKFTRVCAYDRAGLGGSSRGPQPRTSQQMADEFAALLEKGDIPGPYVLVSHATSNWIDRLYTAQHRDQVAALVFVSPFHEDMISGTLAILAPYPADLATNRAEMASQGEGQSVDDWLTSADQVRAVGTLDNLPLILVAKGKIYPDSKPYAAQMDAMLAQQEQQLLALSTNSVRLVAEQSGHFIQTDQPQAVVDAIHQAISSIPAGDRFEPNNDFDQAQPIELNIKYDNLNFVQPDSNSSDWDNDFFKVRVKPGQTVTCRTLDLAPITDTNLILYDENRNGLEGNDDVNRAAGDKSSSVSYAVKAEGWLYVLIGEGFSRTPSEAQQTTYSLECSTSK